MRKKLRRIEVCANSVTSCIAAQEGGAYRVELCDNLYEGGTTPSAATIEFARKNIDIKLNVLIRPRGGDFCYSDLEFAIMKRDIEIAKNLGADGIVFGILLPDGTIDNIRIKELVKLAHPMTVTFHRAFDMVDDPYQSLNDLLITGVNCLLTSGLKNKAIEGLDTIAELVKMSDGKISIMVGRGVNEGNIQEIVKKTNAPEYHLSGRVGVPSKMIYRNPNVFMGGISEIPEYEVATTDSDVIQKVVELANNIN